MSGILIAKEDMFAKTRGVSRNLIHVILHLADLERTVLSPGQVMPSADVNLVSSPTLIPSPDVNLNVSLTPTASVVTSAKIRNVSRNLILAIHRPVDLVLSVQLTSEVGKLVSS